MSRNIEVVIVGSIGIDTIETPFELRKDLLGGSVSYAGAGASFFCSAGMIGVVGDDFPDEHMKTYSKLGIDSAGLKQLPGKTFRWSGSYDPDMINRRTLSTELNVFEQFAPDVPETYRNAGFFLLGNISPDLQMHVLNQANRPEFVVADTMDLWINTERKRLLEVIERVDMLTLNDSEARLLMDHYNLKTCAREIRKLGPRYVVIKKGEHGAMMLADSGIFLVPAFPVDAVKDPTGAGDTFAGGFIGALASAGEISDDNVRRALLTGSVVASFGVEDFSLAGLTAIDRETISERLEQLTGMTTI